MSLSRPLVRLVRWALFGSRPTPPPASFPTFLVEPLEERFVLSPMVLPWMPGLPSQAAGTAQVEVWSDPDVPSSPDTISLVSDANQANLELPHAWIAAPPLLEPSSVVEFTAIRVESTDLFLPPSQPQTAGSVAPTISAEGFIQPPASDPTPTTVSENGSGNAKAEPSLSVLRLPLSPNLLGSPAPPSFQIQRASAADTTLTVPYLVRSFSRHESTSVSQVAVLASGSAKVDVPLVWLENPSPSQPEIVTVTLQSSPSYRVAQPTTTWFVSGDPGSCSDSALLQAHQQAGSKEAFETLVERHQQTVLQSCYRVLGNWHDAEEVSQMVFLVLAQGRVRLSTTLTAWLRTVARHAAIVFWRARNRRAKHERQAAKPERFDEKDSELREQLEAALARLPAPLREAVRLRYLEGCSQREAAELLGCPRGTLSQRASLGLRYLRQLFGCATTTTHPEFDSRFL